MKVTSEAEVNLVPRSQMPLLDSQGRTGDGNREGKAKGGRGTTVYCHSPSFLTSGGCAQVTYCRKTAVASPGKTESSPVS